jgi:hypothetical protein
MEFKVKNKVVEIKFDYRTMFKVDKQLATKNKLVQVIMTVSEHYSTTF